MKVIVARLYPSPEIDLVSENIWDDEVLRRFLGDGIVPEALPVGPPEPIRLRLTAKEVKRDRVEGGGPA